MKGNMIMKRVYVKNNICFAGIVLAVVAVLTGCGGEEKKTSYELTDMPKISTDESADIDLDALNESVNSIKNLDLGPEAAKKENVAPEPVETEDEQKAEPEGDLTEYSYTDVVRSGDDITVTPNGGLNDSTVLYGDKDLKGFLDYVDGTVLEQGRTINRDMFYDLIAIMLVDKDLNSDFDQIEKNMVMALAVANNFHDVDVSIKDCYLDANNAAEYRYNVRAFGTDDTWIINYGRRTFYMNDGATEYHSDMFKDEYLAVWMVAIEEYYL